MNLLPRFLRKGGPVVESKDEQITFNELLDRMASQGKVSSGGFVTPATAMKCTTIQGIVRALTNAIGSYAPSIGKVTNGEAGIYVSALPNHGTNRLLRRPNAVQTNTEFYRMIMKHLALYGNFYGIKGQGQSGPIGFIRPIEDPDAVQLDDVNWGTGATWKANFDGGTRFISQSQMFHVSSGIPTEDGVTGESPVNLAREAIGICVAAEQLIAELYGNSAMPSVVITGGKFAKKEQYDLWRSAWRASFGAGADRGGAGLLQDGMGIEQLNFSPADAQVLEMRKFQRTEIAQVYGVPPHKLADLERATFSNIEEQSLEFVRDVAKPWVRLIEQAMARDLLTDADQRDGVVVRFDMEAATEGKLSDRMAAYAKGYEIGAYNPNEIRQKLGEDPRKDEAGEAYATPLNMRTTDNVSDNTEGESPGGDDEEGGADSGSIRSIR